MDRNPVGDRYRFERLGDARRREPADAEADLSVLLDRLAVSRSHRRKVREILRPLVIESHLCIDWYQGAMANAFSVRRRILGWAWALVAAMPWMAWGLSHWAGDVAAVTSAGCGFAALAAAAVAAREKRRAGGGFWEAGAAMKSRLYRFETTWRGRVVPDRGSFEHVAEAVHTEILEARAIAASEQRAFFGRLTDPAPVLAGASRARRAAAHAVIRRARDELADLDDLIARRQSELRCSDDDDEARDLITSIEGLETRRQVLELHVATEQSLASEPGAIAMDTAGRNP